MYSMNGIHKINNRVLNAVRKDIFITSRLSKPVTYIEHALIQLNLDHHLKLVINAVYVIPMSLIFINNKQVENLKLG